MIRTGALVVSGDRPTKTAKVQQRGPAPTQAMPLMVRAVTI
jgi:hypothetical protein